MKASLKNYLFLMSFLAVIVINTVEAALNPSSDTGKPFFFEKNKGQWINISACERIYIEKSIWGEYYVIWFGFTKWSFYLDKQFDSFEEAQQFLQEEIFDKLM